MLTRRSRTLAVSAVLACTLLSVAGAGAQTTERTYACKWPLFGMKRLTVTSTLEAYGPWYTGEPAPPLLDVTASASGMTSAFKVIRGAAAIRGTITSGVGIDSAISKPVHARVENTFGPLPLSPAPAPGEPHVFTSNGPQAPLLQPDDGGAPVPYIASDAGPHRVALESFTLHVQFLDAWTSPIRVSTVAGAPDPTTMDVPCSLDPADQDPALGELPVDDAPEPTPTPAPTPNPSHTYARFSYTLEGTTSIPTLSKNLLPLTGRIDLTLDIWTGEFTATTSFLDTKGRQTALGFLPVTMTLGIVPSGPTTGLLNDDQLTASLAARIKVKSVKAFGAIPIAAGNTCQSKSLSTISIASTDSFDPTSAGGTLGGTYAISDLNGCDILGGYVSPLTAGTGNTISLKLTPSVG